MKVLARRREPDVVPILLERVTDWVSGIAELAVQSLWERLNPEHAPIYLQCLPAIERLSARKRFPMDLRREVHALLSSPACLDTLRLGLASPDRRSRQVCFALAFAHSGFRSEDLILLAGKDPDTAIRLLAVRHAGKDAAILQQAACDPAPLVRREAYARLGPLPQFLFDRTSGLRRECQRAIPDAAAAYRQRLAQTDTSTRLRATALLGLGETGDSQDAPNIAACLYDLSPRVRVAAMAALRRLNRSADFLPSLYSALGAANHRVVREAVHSILAIREAGVAELWRLAGVRRAVLPFVHKASIWMQLSVYLEAAQDPSLRSLAIRHLDEWLSRSVCCGSPLPDSSRTELLRLLDRADPHLDRGLEEQVRFALHGAEMASTRQEAGPRSGPAPPESTRS